MEPFAFTIDGREVTVNAPTFEQATQAAQSVQQSIRAGQEPPPVVYWQGDAPQLTPDPADIRTQQQEGIQDFWQRGANAGQGLTDIGQGMLTGAADMAMFGADDEIGGFIRGALSPNETVGEAIDANRAFKAEQNPTAMMAGGVLGGLAMIPTAGRIIPTLPFARGPSTAARVTNAAATGAVGGAAYGAGSADGRPMLPYMGAGAVGGAALAPLGNLIGSTARGVGNLLRRQPTSERYLGQLAAGSVEGALARDAVGGALPSNGAPGQYLRRSADTVQQERGLGMPLTLADTGGSRTRGLARTAANLSDDGKAILDAELSPRFAEQGPRMQDQLSDITGMPRTPDTSGRIASMEAQARIENAPRYDAAYFAPEAQAMWTPRLQELTRSPAIRDAMRDVNRTAANDAALSGRPAVVNPFVGGAGGGLRLNAGAVPNLEYWDIVQRNLNTAIENAIGGERRQLQQLRSALLDELDAAVPAFREARAGAAAWFGATDAAEAGQMMARDMNMENAEFRRAFDTLSPAEQDLFREGYSNQIMDRLSAQGDNRNAALMGVFNTPKGRERTAIVFGRQVADEIENTVRLENVMNLTRTAVQGNSTTARQLIDAARAFGRSPTSAAAGVGGATAFAAGALRWEAVLAAGLVWGARKAQGALNEAVAQRAATLLASGDANAIREAASLLAATPVGNIALRNMEAQLSRVITTQANAAGFDRLESIGMPGFPAAPQ